MSDWLGNMATSAATTAPDWAGVSFLFGAAVMAVTGIVRMAVLSRESAMRDQRQKEQEDAVNARLKAIEGMLSDDQRRMRDLERWQDRHDGAPRREER